jgi:sialate O-acetylesterase
MNKQITIAFLLFSMLVFPSRSLKASEWANLVKLDGQWKFSVGDNKDWAKPSFNDGDWDRVQVPGNWERYYEGYNGFAWYRIAFDVKWTPEKGDISLFLGRIDDVDEVFLNGVKIGQTGSFMPNFKTGYDIDRKYAIPAGLLQKANNVIAVRVYDTGRDGGIMSGKIGIFYDNDSELLALDLSGQWKFSIYRKSGMMEKNFDDSKWDDIKVPATWESQGYPDHDGLGWYRKKFTVPSNLASQNLYLVLGQIDDMDKVYLNGSLLARTEILDNYSKFRNYNAYRLYRVYELPKSKLELENVLTIEVMDNAGLGGIYEGPIGLMTGQNANIIKERNKEDYYNDPIRSIFNFFLGW